MKVTENRAIDNDDSADAHIEVEEEQLRSTNPLLNAMDEKNLWTRIEMFIHIVDDAIQSLSREISFQTTISGSKPMKTLLNRPFVDDIRSSREDKDRYTGPNNNYSKSVNTMVDYNIEPSMPKAMLSLHTRTKDYSLKEETVFSRSLNLVNDPINPIKDDALTFLHKPSSFDFIPSQSYKPQVFSTGNSLLRQSLNDAESSLSSMKSFSKFLSNS
jgi:hypothetical protein